MADTPADWVTMKAPIWPETVVTGDGCHYTTDGKGRVAVRPYHVVELIGKDGFTLADDGVAQVYLAAVQKAEQRGLPLDRDALAVALAKAATQAATSPPAPAPDAATAPDTGKSKG